MTRHPVQQPEIDGFGCSPKVRRHHGRVNVEHPGGGFGVDVPSGFEGFTKPFVPAEVRQYAELDLGVVGRNEQPSLFPWDKALPEPLRPFPELRQVLDVRVPARQSAGSRRERVESRMDRPGRRFCRVQECLDETAHQLGEFPVFEQKPGDFPFYGVESEGFEDRSVRGGPGFFRLKDGEPEFLEKQLPDLLWRVEVDQSPRFGRNFLRNSFRSPSEAGS